MATTTFRETHPNIPNEQDINTRLEQIDQLKDFLANAPIDFVTIEGQPPIKRHLLPNGDSISCVQWNATHFITGTDIVRCLIFRFHAFGRPVSNLKKFEEGIFSDLRNLKPGTDATLEEPKSSFLDLLYRHNCIRTQKKQKVFFWQSVPHDRLFLDALERDLKREKLSQEVTSVAVAYPANTITLDATQAMFDEFRRTLLCNIELEACLSGRTANNNNNNNNSSSSSNNNSNSNSPRGSASSTGMPSPSLSAKESTSPLTKQPQPSTTTAPEEWSEPRSPTESSLTRMAHSIFGQFSLFEGSPMYKQRRRKSTRHPSSLASFQSHPVPDPTDASLMIRSRWSPYDRPLSRRGSSDEVLRSYFCPFPSCGKDFRRLEHLKRHLRTHTMERPYLCNVCGKRFSRSDNLAQHKKTHERRHHVFASDSSDEGTDKEDDDSSDDTLEQFSPTQENMSLKGLHGNPSYHHDSTNTPDTTTKHPDWIKTEPLDRESDGEDWVNPIPSLSGSTFTSTASSCTSTPVRTKVHEPIVEDEDDLFYRDGFLPSPTYMLSYTSAIYPLDDICYPSENDVLDSAFDQLEYQKTAMDCKKEEESPLPSYVKDIDYMHDCTNEIRTGYELSSSSSSPQSLTASPSQSQQISDLYLHISQSGHGSPHPYEDYGCSSPGLSMLTSGFNYHIDTHNRSTMRPTDALIRF